jgi:hypothetical protein
MRADGEHVRLWYKADMPLKPGDVRFEGQSGLRDFTASSLVLGGHGNGTISVFDSDRPASQSYTRKWEPSN